MFALSLAAPPPRWAALSSGFRPHAGQLAARAAGRGSARLYLFHSSFQPKKSIEGKMATDTRLTLIVFIKPHSVIFFYCYINFLTSLTTSQQYFLSWEGLVWFQWSWNLPLEQYSHHISERSVLQEFCMQCVRK